MSNFLTEILNVKLQDVTLAHLVLIAFVGIVTILAIKITITFDWNKYQKTKDEKLKAKLQNACSHLQLNIRDDGIEYKSFFQSPSGTHLWHCSRCGQTRYSYSEEDMLKKATFYFQNRNRYYEDNKKFNKIMKKLGYL